jgi:hypothetical protein
VNEVGLAAGASEEAVVPDAVEAAWQDMHAHFSDHEQPFHTMVSTRFA